MTNPSTRTDGHPRTSRVLGLVLVSILAVLLLAGSGALASASTSTGYDNVQIFVQTSRDLPYSYTITAYNTTGYQVAYYQSNYAAAAFELPNGTYLFTVQASYGQSNYPCIGCVIPITNITAANNRAIGAGKPPDSGGPMIPANSSLTNSTGVTPVVVPIFRLSSSNEYGFAVEQVTGPSSVTINTQNATTLPTSQVTVHVAYANGTVAEGVWVYASVVDDDYYVPNSTSSAQTGADGNAILTMPQAPLLVTSDLSVPITLPHLQTNYTVIIGGQRVNVTLYWQPNSITMQGQTLILPPQTGGTITLQYQPQVFHPFPLQSSGASGIPGATTTLTSVTAISTVNGQKAAQPRIPPFSPADGQPATPAGPSRIVATNGAFGGGILLPSVVAAMAVALVALALVLVTVRGRSKPSIVSA